MTKEEILEMIQLIMRKLFMDDGIIVTRETQSSDVDGWDSFEHINLLVSIESKFHIRFDMARIEMAKNIGDLVDLVYSEVN